MKYLLSVTLIAVVLMPLFAQESGQEDSGGKITEAISDSMLLQQTSRTAYDSTEVLDSLAIRGDSVSMVSDTVARLDSSSVVPKELKEPEEEKKIYFESFSLVGSVHNKKNNSNVKAKIKVEIASDKDADKVMFPTSSSGSFNIPNLVSGKDYIFYVKARGYYPFADTVHAQESLENNKIRKEFRLRAVVKGESIKLEGVQFEQGTSHLDPLSYNSLNLLVETLKDNPDMRIRLEGHTDNTASKQASIKLSEQRVESVKIYLVNRGIDKKRIDGKGYGSSKPITNSATAANRAENRRVEFKVLGN